MHNYLISIESTNSLSIGAHPAKNVILSFTFHPSASANVFERVCIPEEGLERIYSINQHEGSFSRGSRRLVLISGIGLPLEKAYKVTTWVNFEGQNVFFLPAKITLYRIKKSTKLNQRIIGDVDRDFQEVCTFLFRAELSLTSTTKAAVAYNSNTEIAKWIPVKTKTFLYRLHDNLLRDNLWLSIFLNRTWSNFNRRARITVAILTLVVANLTNIMYYKVELKNIPYYPVLAVFCYQTEI